MRFIAMQICPMLRNDLRTAPFTASASLQALLTMSGHCPPSSRDTFFMLSAHWRITWRPTSVEPVKATFFTRGCRIRRGPAWLPEPKTTFTTPCGAPASARHPMNARGERGVRDGGLATIAQPAASAAPTFQATSSMG